MVVMGIMGVGLHLVLSVANGMWAYKFEYVYALKTLVQGNVGGHGLNIHI